MLCLACACFCGWVAGGPLAAVQMEFISEIMDLYCAAHPASATTTTAANSAIFATGATALPAASNPTATTDTAAATDTDTAAATTAADPTGADAGGEDGEGGEEDDLNDEAPATKRQRGR